MGAVWSVKSQADVCDIQSQSELTFGFLLQLPITGNRYRWHRGAIGVVVFTPMFLSAPKAGISTCIHVICQQLLCDEMFYFSAKNCLKILEGPDFTIYCYVI